MLLRNTCCVLRVTCCVLRAACCVLRVSVYTCDCTEKTFSHHKGHKVGLHLNVVSFFSANLREFPLIFGRFLSWLPLISAD